MVLRYSCFPCLLLSLLVCIIYLLCTLESIHFRGSIHRSENGIAKIALDFLKRSTFSIVGAVAVLKLTYLTLL